MSAYAPWAVFGGIVVAIFIVDFFVINRNAHEIRVRESLIVTLLINIVVVLFAFYVRSIKGDEAMLQFFTGYVVEYALSVDNLFVFLVLFSLFKVPERYRHRVLFYGILFAIFARMAFIFLGVAVVSRFHWMLYLLGAFLVYTGVKLFFEKEDDERTVMEGWFFRRLCRIIPLKKELCEHCFFVRDGGKWFATPLFMCLIAVEISDILFAFDSVPAILTISRDRFVIYTSNLFAILGLRSLFFALSGALRYFRFLNYGLAIILSFIGVKILVEEWWRVPIGIALGFVGVVLGATVILSMLLPEKKED